MVLSGFSQVVGINSRIFFNRFSKGFIVFNVKIELVKRLVDFFSVGLLDNFEERLAELNDIEFS